MRDPLFDLLPIDEDASTRIDKLIMSRLPTETRPMLTAEYNSDDDIEEFVVDNIEQKRRVVIEYINGGASIGVRTICLDPNEIKHNVPFMDAMRWVSGK